jgi:hypothetical protein
MGKIDQSPASMFCPLVTVEWIVSALGDLSHDVLRPAVDDGDEGQDAGRAEQLHLQLPEEDRPSQGFQQKLVLSDFRHGFNDS